MLLPQNGSPSISLPIWYMSEKVSYCPSCKVTVLQIDTHRLAVKHHDQQALVPRVLTYKKALKNQYRWLHSVRLYERMTGFT